MLNAVKRYWILVVLLAIAIALTLIYSFLALPLLAQEYKIETSSFLLEKDIREQAGMHYETVSFESKGGVESVLILLVPKELAQDANDVEFSQTNSRVEILREDPILKLTPKNVGEKQVIFTVSAKQPTKRFEGLRGIPSFGFPRQFFEGLNELQKGEMLSKMALLGQVSFTAEKAKAIENEVMSIDFESENAYPEVIRVLDELINENDIQKRSVEVVSDVFNPLAEGSMLEIESTYAKDEAKVEVLDDEWKYVRVLQPAGELNDGKGIKYVWMGERENGELAGEGRFHIVVSSKGEVRQIISVEVLFGLDLFEHIPQELMEEPKIINIFLNKLNKKNSAVESWCILGEEHEYKFEIAFDSENTLQPQVQAALEKVLLFKPYLAKKLDLEKKLDEEEKKAVQYFIENKIGDKIDLLNRSRQNLDYLLSQILGKTTAGTIESLISKGVLEEKPCLLRASAELQSIPEIELTAFAAITPTSFFEKKEPIQLQVHAIKTGAVVSLRGKESEQVGEIVAREYGWKHIVLDSKPAAIYFKDRFEFDFTAPIKDDKASFERQLNVRVEPDGYNLHLGEYYFTEELEVLHFVRAENKQAIVELIEPSATAKMALKEIKKAEFEFRPVGYTDTQTFYFEGFAIKAGRYMMEIMSGGKIIFNSESEWRTTHFIKIAGTSNLLRYNGFLKEGKAKISLTLYPTDTITKTLIENPQSKRELRVPAGKETTVGQKKLSFDCLIVPKYLFKQPVKSITEEKSASVEAASIQSLSWPETTYLNGEKKTCTRTSLIYTDEKYGLAEADGFLLICPEQQLDTATKSRFSLRLISAKNLEEKSFNDIHKGNQIEMDDGFSFLLASDGLKILQEDKVVFTEPSKNFSKNNYFAFNVLLKDRFVSFEITEEGNLVSCTQTKFKSIEDKASEQELSFEGVLPDDRRIHYLIETEEMLVGDEKVDFSETSETPNYSLEKTKKGATFYYNKTISGVSEIGLQAVSLSLKNPVKEIEGREIRLNDIDFAAKTVQIMIDNRLYPINLIAGKISYNPMAFEGEYDRTINVLTPKLKGNPVLFEFFPPLEDMKNYVSETTKIVDGVEIEEGATIEGIKVVPQIDGALVITTSFPVGRTGLPLVERIKCAEADSKKSKEAFFGAALFKWEKTAGWTAKIKAVTPKGEEKFFEVTEANKKFVIKYEDKEGANITQLIDLELVERGWFSAKQTAYINDVVSGPASIVPIMGLLNKAQDGLALQLQEATYPKYRIIYTGPKAASIENLLKGLKSQTIALPIDEPAVVGGKSLLLKKIVFKEGEEKAVVVVDNSEETQFSTKQKEIKLFGTLALQLKSVPDPIFEMSLIIFKKNDETYRISFLPLVKELRQKVAAEYAKEPFSYLMILSNFFDLPATSEVFIKAPSIDVLEQKLAKKTMVIDNLFYGNVNDDPYIEVISGRVPFSNRKSLLKYFRNLPVAKKMQPINFVIYPDKGKIILPERIIHQIDLAGEFPEINLNNYPGVEDNTRNLKFVSNESKMTVSIAPPIPSFNNMLTKSGLFFFATHGIADSLIVTNSSSENILSYSASNIPNMPNRPTIVTVSCNTGIDLSYAFLDRGASVYVAAMTPVRVTFAYLPLEDELVSVGDEFKTIVNAKITEGEYKEDLEGALIILGSPIIRLMPIHQRKNDFAVTYSKNTLCLRLPALDLDSGFPDTDTVLPVVTFLTKEEKIQIKEKKWEEFEVQEKSQKWRLLRIRENGRGKNIYIGDLGKGLLSGFNEFEYTDSVPKEVKDKVMQMFPTGNNTFFVLDSPSAAYIEFTEDKSNYFIIWDSGQPIDLSKSENNETIASMQEAKTVSFKVGEKEFKADGKTTVEKKEGTILIKPSYADLFNLIEAGALEKPFEIHINLK